MHPRPGCVSLNGICPTGDGLCEFWISKDLIQFFYKKGWLDKFKELYLVKEILAAPNVIFMGLGREGQEEAFCYAGLASCRYSREGRPLPPPLGKTFAIYVLSNYEIFRWGWEVADGKAMTYPQGYDDPERFGRQLWPKI